MMRTLLLAIVSFSISLAYGQMQLETTWKLTGNAATFLEQNNIDSTKVHFLSGDVFLITYESNSTQYTETSTWTESTAGTITITYDPAGFFFGNNCPTESTTFDYSIVSNSFTMTNVNGTCSIATGLLANSTWVKQSNVGVDNLDLIALSAFPNPASSYMSIKSDEIIEPSELSFFDFSGRKMVVNVNNMDSKEVSISVAQLEKGTYFIKYKSAVLRFEVY